jgi:hypothetical protein
MLALGISLFRSARRRDDVAAPAADPATRLSTRASA